MTSEWRCPNCGKVFFDHRDEFGGVYDALCPDCEDEEEFGPEPEEEEDEAF